MSVGFFHRVGHLARRFWGSLSSTPPGVVDVEWAHGHLAPAEVELWEAMAVQDRRHSVAVARCVASREPARDVVAGALLHDVGKSVSGLGTWARVVATVVGPRGRRFRDYHDHERLGAEMARAAGSAEATVALIRGDGPASTHLRACDDI